MAGVVGRKKIEQIKGTQSVEGKGESAVLNKVLETGLTERGAFE